MSNGNAEVVILAKDATLRDMFAAKALQGILGGSDWDKEAWTKEYAKLAYLYADAMLKERDK